MHVPIRILPDNGGVEYHGRFLGQFRVAGQEMNTSVREYESKLAHTQKLPSALDTYMKENRSNPRYDEIGPMIIERTRLEDEIQFQEKELEADPVKLDQTKFEVRTCQTSVILPFGWSSLGLKSYWVVQVPKSQSAPVATSTTIQPSTPSIK